MDKPRTEGRRNGQLEILALIVMTLQEKRGKTGSTYQDIQEEFRTLQKKISRGLKKDKGHAQ